jgi:hypothetical protein
MKLDATVSIHVPPTRGAELADMRSTPGWVLKTFTHTNSAFGVPAGAERPRPCRSARQESQNARLYVRSPEHGGMAVYLSLHTIRPAAAMVLSRGLDLNFPASPVRVNAPHMSMKHANILRRTIFLCGWQTGRLAVPRLQRWGFGPARWSGSTGARHSSLASWPARQAPAPQAYPRWRAVMPQGSAPRR